MLHEARFGANQRHASGSKMQLFTTVTMRKLHLLLTELQWCDPTPWHCSCNEASSPSQTPQLHQGDSTWSPMSQSLPGCDCMSSRHRVCFHGWREKTATRLRVIPVQGRLHIFHNKPQVLASGSEPCSGHAAGTTQPSISGVSKAQPGLPAAHRGIFFIVLPH